MAPTIAVLATLDTKGTEAAFVKQHIEALGGEAILIDMGLVGEPGTSPDVDRSAVITAGGSSLEALLESPDRQEAAPILIAGTTAILREMLAEGRIDAVLGPQAKLIQPVAEPYGQTIGDREDQQAETQTGRTSPARLARQNLSVGRGDFHTGDYICTTHSGQRLPPAAKRREAGRIQRGSAPANACALSTPNHWPAVTASSTKPGCRRPATGIFT